MPQSLKLDEGRIATAGALAFVIKTMTNSAREIAAEIEDGDTPFAGGTTEPDARATQRARRPHEVDDLSVFRSRSKHDLSFASFNRNAIATPPCHR